jgi:hypothetical protein
MNATKVFLAFTGILIIGNLLFLDIKLLSEKRLALADRVVIVEERLTSLIMRDEVEESVVVAVDGNESREIGDEKEEELVEEEEAIAAKTVYVSAPAVVKEVFIPLGSGSTNSTEWTTTSAQGYVDTSVYPSLQTAYLQATLRSNSGSIRARLLQNTDGVVVVGSEITSNVPESKFIGSSQFGLSSGNKLYVVQLRSETGQDVFVENARLRLVLN